MARLHKTGKRSRRGKPAPSAPRAASGRGPAGARPGPARAPRRHPAQLKIGAAAGRKLVWTFAAGAVTYQREFVSCGKKNCGRCRSGPAHGPYWYAYFWSSSRGRTVSKYVGKTLPRPLVGRDEAEDFDDDVKPRRSA